MNKTTVVFIGIWGLFGTTFLAHAQQGADQEVNSYVKSTLVRQLGSEMIIPAEQAPIGSDNYQAPADRGPLAYTDPAIRNLRSEDFSENKYPERYHGNEKSINPADQIENLIADRQAAVMNSQRAHDADVDQAEWELNLKLQRAGSDERINLKRVDAQHGTSP